MNMDGRSGDQCGSPKHLHGPRAARQRTRGPRTLTMVMAIGTLLVGSGCTQNGRWTQSDYHLSYGLPLEDRASLSDPYDDADLEDLSVRISLVSDNQRHELLGDGVELFRTSVSDEHVASAIRPPQLDLFGQDLLNEALGMTDSFVLHLGDACDISNTGEFGHFAWDMRHAPRGWVMAPGNHDGFFFGNSSRTVKSLIAEWNGSAETYAMGGSTIDSRAMQKDRYVSYYLASLILQEAIWSEPLARSISPECARMLTRWTEHRGVDDTGADPRTFQQYWNALEQLQEAIHQRSEPDRDYFEFELAADRAPAGQPHLRRVAWHIDKKHVWKSYILQEVDLSTPTDALVVDAPPISILVLDTAQYGFLPGLDAGLISGISSFLTLGFFDVQAAGLHGNILPTQERAAEDFAADMQAENRHWLLATHHPYRVLGRATRPRFDRLRDAGGIPATLSAHTHAGELNWHEDGAHDGAWLEINVGSILDAPVEYRDFQVQRLAGRMAISSRRHLMADQLREQDRLIDDIPGYRPSPGDPDYYLDYQRRASGSATEADFTVKRILLAAYLRLYRHFEPDHPDQSTTHWPAAPDGTTLSSHRAVTDAVLQTLADAEISRLEELTQFLYEIREYDRTRRYTDETAERLRSYRLSQAIWASRAELTTRGHAAAQVDPDISLILLPRSITDSTDEPSRHAQAR